jgi:hypothetical protein
MDHITIKQNGKEAWPLQFCTRSRSSGGVHEWTDSYGMETFIQLSQLLQEPLWLSRNSNWLRAGLVGVGVRVPERSRIFISACHPISQKPQEALNLLVTEECYWVLFYMPLYMFLRNLLNVLVQITNKMGFEKICIVQTGSGAHSPSFRMSTGDTFSVGKAAGSWSWLFTSNYCRGNKNRNYTFTSPYAFMA